MHALLARWLLCSDDQDDHGITDIVTNLMNNHSRLSEINHFIAEVVEALLIVPAGISNTASLLTDCAYIPLVFKHGSQTRWRLVPHKDCPKLNQNVESQLDRVKPREVLCWDPVPDPSSQYTASP